MENNLTSPLNAPVEAQTPSPLYYAVIFTSKRTKDKLGFNTMSDCIESLVKSQPEFLGMESASNGLGSTGCCRKDMALIKNWLENTEHQETKKQGQEKWYAPYRVRISKVEFEY